MPPQQSLYKICAVVQRSCHVKVAHANRFVLRKLVGGPGFEPGASRSRIRRYSVQTCQFLRVSVRFVARRARTVQIGMNLQPGLLHELLQNAGRPEELQGGHALRSLSDGVSRASDAKPRWTRGRPIPGA